MYILMSTLTLVASASFVSGKLAVSSGPVCFTLMSLGLIYRLRLTFKLKANKLFIYRAELVRDEKENSDWFLYKGFRATLNFRKFIYLLIYINFAKSCILSCLSKFYSKKKFHHAVFEI